MARPLPARELYDADIQALLRVNGAVLLDGDITEEEQERIQEGLTYTIRVLRRISDARRPEVKERFISDARKASGE